MQAFRTEPQDCLPSASFLCMDFWRSPGHPQSAQRGCGTCVSEWGMGISMWQLHLPYSIACQTFFFLNQIFQILVSLLFFFFFSHTWSRHYNIQVKAIGHWLAYLTWNFQPFLFAHLRSVRVESNFLPVQMGLGRLVLGQIFIWQVCLHGIQQLQKVILLPNCNNKT